MVVQERREKWCEGRKHNFGSTTRSRPDALSMSLQRTTPSAAHPAAAAHWKDIFKTCVGELGLKLELLVVLGWLRHEKST